MKDTEQFVHELAVEREDIVAQIAERVELGNDLEGKVFVITGGNRIKQSIGGAMAIGLARRGATIVAPHLHDSSEIQLQAEQVRIAAEKAGGHFEDFICDVTDRSSMEKLFNYLLTSYGRVDGLIQLPAGGIRGSDEEAEQLNVRAPVEITRILSGLMPPGSIVATTPSTPSKYLSIKAPVKRYARTQQTKHRGDMALDNEMEELSKRGIRRVSIVAGPVIDTAAMNLMMRKMSDDEKMEMQNNAWTYGENRSPLRADMAYALVKVVTANPEDVPTGSIEFVGFEGIDRYGVAEALPMYGPDKRLPDDIMFVGNNQAVASMRVTHERSKSPLQEGEISLDGYDRGHFTVTHEHTKGHFTGNTSPKVFRGVDQIAAAIMTARAGMQKYGVDNPVLDYLKGVTFKWPMLPNTNVEVRFSNLMVELGDLRLGARRANIELIGAEDTKLMDIADGRMVASDNTDSETAVILHNRLTQGIELAAQTLLVIGMRNAGVTAEDVAPLFGGIDSIVLHSLKGSPGETLEAEVMFMENEAGGFIGDAKLYDDGRFFAEIKGMSGILKNKASVRRYIEKKGTKLLRLQPFI